MKISVVAPVFNVEDYLPDCIESVLQQTYTDYELILMDDGSTDGSGAICDHYSKSYPEHIKAIHLENGGPLKARLLGIREARGDIIVFIDSDDCLRNDALEKISECFGTTNCDMLLFDAEECTMFPSIPINHSLKNGTIFENESKKELYQKIVLGQIPNSVCLKAIRRECATFPQNYLDYTARHGEDLLLSACFITNSSKIVYLSEGLYHYRNRPGSAIHSFNVNRKESIKAVHTELEKYVEIWETPELKPLHNARKVKGWVENTKLLFKNKRQMTRREFNCELVSMAEDPYFRCAYMNMDRSSISEKDRIIARFLYKRQFYLLSILLFMKDIVKK